MSSGKKPHSKTNRTDPLDGMEGTHGSALLTKDFFRQIPNVLLARYFHARSLFNDLDFSAMKETQPEELFEAWLTLPDDQRNEMDAEFREIFELSCEVR